MPLMTKPLAHVEMTLSTVRYMIAERKDSKTKIEAAIAVLEHVESELRYAIEHERAKLPNGDK